MPAKQELLKFIRSTFPSVWSLELLLFLKANSGRAWSAAELVAALRGSELLVTRSLDSLLAADLIDRSTEGAVIYRPASTELAHRMEQVAAEYARSPDAVRRAIISAAAGSDLTAFADAFRLKRD